MKILITGNMGYVGPCAVSELRQKYPEAMLIGLDTGYFAHCLTNRNFLPESKLDMQYYMDIRNISAQILDGVDAVVHLAAVSNDPIGNRFEQVTEDINHKATMTLAKMAKIARVKHFVFASSCSIYGVAEGDFKTESEPLNPLTAYSKAKVAVERDLKELSDKNFIVTCLRFATACGMSDRLRLDLVLNDFVACAYTTKEITILSDGTPWRPLIHVRDMARAIDWAVTREVEKGGTFLAVNTGSNTWNYQVRELAEAVAELIPRVSVSINEKAEPDKRSYRVSFDLFRELAPNHQPQYTLYSAIADIRDGLEAIEFRTPDFRNSHFVRLNVLERHIENGYLDEDLIWTH